jgi:hypothetical protein
MPRFLEEEHGFLADRADLFRRRWRDRRQVASETKEQGTFPPGKFQRVANALERATRRLLVAALDAVDV